MTQAIELTEADIKTRKQIRFMKDRVKVFAVRLRDFKLCRKTKNPHTELLDKYGIDNQPLAQALVMDRRRGATAALIVYGELRGKPHPVQNPERWTFAVEQTKEFLEKQEL